MPKIREEPAENAAPQFYMDSGVENINADVAALIEANTPTPNASLTTTSTVIPSDTS